MQPFASLIFKAVHACMDIKPKNRFNAFHAIKPIVRKSHESP